jgi:hypothetical protein
MPDYKDKRRSGDLRDLVWWLTLMILVMAAVIGWLMFF